MKDVNLEQALHKFLGLSCPGPDCPSLPRLQAAVRHDDWTAAERWHVHGCRACRRTLDQVRRADSDDLDLTALSAGTAPSEAEIGAALLELLEADAGQLRPGRPMLVRLILQSGSFEVDHALDRRSSAETRVLPRPTDLRSWSLRSVDDEAALPLADELAQRFYGDSDVRQLQLWLHALPVDGRPGWFRPQLEVFAAPTHAPMTLMLTFADGQVRTLVVTPRPSRRRARSEPGEPLAAAAFAFDPAATPIAGPMGTLPRVELRSAACRVAPALPAGREAGLQSGNARELLWLARQDFLQGLDLRVRNWPESLAWPTATVGEPRDMTTFGVDAFVLAACMEKCAGFLPADWPTVDALSRNTNHDHDRRARVG